MLLLYQVATITIFYLYPLDSSLKTTRRGISGLLPLQDAVPGCLTHCSPEWSADSGCSRVVEKRGLDEAGELTELWCLGTQRDRQRPQQP